MLVHASRNLIPQNVIFNQILEYKSLLSAAFGGGAIDISSTSQFQAIKKLWEEDFEKNLNKKENENFTFEDICKEIKTGLINKIQAVQLNGNATGSLDDEEKSLKEQMDLDNYLDEGYHVIVIGAIHYREV